jgi:hypothetical protein
MRYGLWRKPIFADAVAQLDAVREAAADPRAAYLIRSRLRRALLSCARSVAETQNLEKPSLPGQWAVGPQASTDIAEIVALCRRVHQNSEHLCQPSESFDVRWDTGWSVLRRDLDELQDALERLDQARTAS